MLRMTVTIENNGQFAKQLSGVVERAEDLRDAFGRVAEDFYGMESALFDSEGSSGGEAWAPLSEPYNTWKQRKVPGAKILHFTGAALKGGVGGIKGASGAGWAKKIRASGAQKSSLRASLTDKESPGAELHIDANSMFVGSNVTVGDWFLAELHQFGTKTMPARPVIQVSDPDADRWLGIIEEHLLDGWQVAQGMAAG